MAGGCGGGGGLLDDDDQVHPKVFKLGEGDGVGLWDNPKVESV